MGKQYLLLNAEIYAKSVGTGILCKSISEGLLGCGRLPFPYTRLEDEWYKCGRPQD